jgi:hypothetical protein
MPRTRLIALVLASAAPAAADDARPVKVLARGPWPHLPTHVAPADRAQRHWAIRSEEELARAAGTAAPATVPKALRVDRIDFTKQMLLAVEDGTQPLVGVSGGGPPSAPNAVSIARVARTDRGLTVTWRRVPPAKGQGVLTRPLEAVLVERAAGEVTFRQAGDKDPPAAGTELKVLARALWPDGWPPEAPRREWVVRGPADLIDRRLAAPEEVLERLRREALARYTKALGVDGIDFARQMVVGVSAGVRPTGSRVEVTGVEVDAGGKAMTVRWRVRGPKPGAKPDGIAHPAEVILVEPFTGPVRFREQPAKAD